MRRQQQREWSMMAVGGTSTRETKPNSRTMWQTILCLVLVFEQGCVESFLPSAPRTFRVPTRRGLLASRIVNTRRVPLSLNAKEDSEDSEDVDAGMAEAFRQLDSLDSLGESDDADSASPLPDGIAKVDTTELEEASSTQDLSPEKEVQMYKNMMESDLEGQSEDDLYSDVLKDMGANAEKTPKSARLSVDQATLTPNEEDTEEFMNQALEEAVKEVNVNNPSISKSVLDDKEIMKEIEEIFERGNEKLMESLEEIRQEQRDLAKASAGESAQTAVDNLEADAKRLSQAEKSMEAMLDRVNKETSEVAKAVEDLKAAQAEVDADFLVKLKSGGIVKQSAFVGLVLFSLRSIFDTVASMGDPSHMTPALIQGGIALACAALFFFV